MKKFKNNKDEDFFTIIEESDEKTERATAPHTLTAEEVLSSGSNQNRKTFYNSHNALDSLRKRMTKAVEELEEKTVITKKEETEDKSLNEKDAFTKSSLYDKCHPYLIDEDGTEAEINSEPLYKLQSVAEILKSDSQKTLERLSKNYDISFDDLGNSPMPSFKTELTDVKPDEISLQPKPIQEPKEEIKEVPKKIISDIDTPITEIKKPENDLIYNTATITFTPVTDDESDKKINIITQTKPINLTGELTKVAVDNSSENTADIKLEKDEFEEYLPKAEINDEKDARRLLRKTSIKKRNYFISTVLSFTITVILAFTLLPFMQGILLAGSSVLMAVILCLASVVILLNIDCFTRIGKITGNDSCPDVLAALSCVWVILYAVFGIIYKENITHLLVLLSFTLSVRSLGRFLKSSYTLNNLKIALSPNAKNTLKLIKDQSITLAMTENSIDGDVLIADTQAAGKINDFMKYSTYGAFLGGKLPIILIISVLLSILTGVICGFYFDGIFYGIYAAAAIQCISCLPNLFLIDNLPLFASSKKLKQKGAMILGKAGAEFAEKANAVVINSDSIFPKGSIILNQMQALSPNNLEDTIIRAASLTECLSSTLAPIFKEIAGTGDVTALPDSDTVKYEDKMGISGWVDNRLLFIGNRTLLETHGIPAPPLELDRKILRQGYFPVYVATQDKACALLVIKYNVRADIAKELRQLTDSGVDLLISSCDPNLTEEMICDYFGLYDDSVKVMSAAGRHTHRNVTAAVNSVSTPAVCGKNNVGIASVLNSALRIKQSNTLLTISYIIFAMLGAIIFTYSSLSATGSLLSEATVLLYGLISTVISFLSYLFRKP